MYAWSFELIVYLRKYIFILKYLCDHLSRNVIIPAVYNKGNNNNMFLSGRYCLCAIQGLRLPGIVYPARLQSPLLFLIVCFRTTCAHLLSGVVKIWIMVSVGSCFQYFLHNVELVRASNVIDLGVTFDMKLSFAEYDSCCFLFRTLVIILKWSVI